MRVRISDLYCLLYCRLRSFTRMGFVGALAIMLTADVAARCCLSATVEAQRS